MPVLRAKLTSTGEQEEVVEEVGEESKAMDDKPEWLAKTKRNFNACTLPWAAYVEESCL